MRRVFAVCVTLAVGFSASAESPLHVLVVESSGAPRLIVPSRDPERPCLVLDPVVDLLLREPVSEPGFWEVRFTGVRLAAALRRQLREYRAPLQMNLVLPAVEM